MFQKKIDRPIRGVIKIGNEEENSFQELDEYVVTNELQKHLGKFFSSYKKGVKGHTDEVGVWISGFFGSGKSHFLKILSYLTKNNKVNGRRAIDFMEDKIHDPMILSDLKLAGNITNDVILFDIDAKSEANSKSDKNSIVRVMNNAFNEMQGFCGSIPWIADIERIMYKDGLYEDFKATFREISSNNWEEAREDFYYEEDSIIEALCRTTEMSEDSARNWFQRAEQEYSISIERFAKRVNEYIESKGDNHHVLFFIDEIGQYIGEDSQLMLNLQTIIHEFGLKCKGKAWVIVTSQEDYDSFMSVRGNDFSKIQGRFDTKLSLSSAYVDEVITKRLLLKNEYGTDTLDELYDKNNSIINNSLTFSDDTAEMKKYTNKQEFIDVYPFVPYQFTLLQKAISEIANHSNSSKHQSRGERSLLNAFQEAAINYSDKNEGSLIPFSAFYQPMEQFLESSTTRVIIQAYKNTRLEKYDVEILKLLFLIKYLKELPSTLENISTLMVEHINEDKIELKRKIEKSLIRLTRETLIQKNGDEYIFLTNDEQDVNREIKNMHVDTAEVIHKLGEEIFGGIYLDKKYRHSAKHHFSFNAKIDDRPIGMQSNSIGLKILTPYYEAEMELNSSELKSMSMRETNVIVKLPLDAPYLDEMEEILKIQSYLKLKSGISVPQAIEDIKTRKSREVSTRKSRVNIYLREAITQAEIYANSQKLDIKEKSPDERINEAFRALVNSLYNKLHYIEEFVDSTKQLHDLLHESEQLTDENNHLAVKEVDMYINRLSTRNHPVTIKTVTSHFSKQPYGWNEIDTTSLLIKLFKDQEIKLLLNSTYLHSSDKDIINYLTKRDFVDRVLVKKRERISPLLLKNVKDLSKELFDISSLPSDEDGLMKRFKELARDEKHRISNLLVYYKNRSYPGQEVLLDGIQLFEELLEIREASTFYHYIRNNRKELKDFAEKVKEVKGFFKNQQDKYDRALDRIDIYEQNRPYINDQEILTTITEIEKVVKHVHPYQNIQKLPELCQAFDERFIELLSEECEPIKTNINQDQLTVMEELEGLPGIRAELASQFREDFNNLKDRLDRVNNFFEAIAMQTESDRLKVRYIDKIQQEVNKKNAQNRQEVEEEHDSDNDREIVTPLKSNKTKTISKQDILRGTKKIENKNDIDKLLIEIREKLEEQLEEDTIITLV